jgi:hypothetical protein
LRDCGIGIKEGRKEGMVEIVEMDMTFLSAVVMNIR